MIETELRAIIIAGPNGAGKTTFAREFLPVEAQCPVFVKKGNGVRSCLLPLLMIEAGCSQ